MYGGGGQVAHYERGRGGEFLRAFKYHFHSIVATVGVFVVFFCSVLEDGMHSML